MKKTGLIFITAFLICIISCNSGDKTYEPEFIDRVVVYQEDDYYMGWPANNGIWMWEDGEIMVGFTRGRFFLRQGHNIQEPFESWLARSTDGGFTWQAFDPEGFVGDSALVLKDLKSPLNFMDENFALRIVGMSYHGSRVPDGGFLYSYDRGNSWEGPFVFNGLNQAEEIKGMILTGRTQYIVESNNSALLFMGLNNPPGETRTSHPFVARTTDGGLSFEFLGWIVDPSDPVRAIMPAGVRTSSGKLLAAVRKPHWIDVFSSDDNGITWEFLSRGGETRGNPPKIIQLSDGRICLAYGNREYNSRIVARFSHDEGKTWGPEIFLRKGTEPESLVSNRSDIGYPQMIQNKDGNIVTIYYWSKCPESENYIEATIWNPGSSDWGEPLYIKDFHK